MADKNKSMELNDKENKKPEKTTFMAEFISWVKVILAAACIAWALTTFIIANSNIPTGSMIPTIMAGDRVIGFRLSYLFSEPERGDVVIFVFGYGCKNCGAQYQENSDGVCPACGRPDSRNSTVYYVKRVIGLPGDTIDIHDGHVYVNNSETPLEEPYLPEPMDTPVALHYEVPEDCYLMLGDNRNHSADARFWQNTYISRDDIIAKVLFRYFPSIGKIE